MGFKKKEIKSEGGHLYTQGKGPNEAWFLNYTTNGLDDNGRMGRRKKTQRIGLVSEMSRDQARIKANEFLLGHKKPDLSGCLTLAQFVERSFEPHHVAMLKPSGRMHYQTYLHRHVVPALGELALDDVTPDAVQELIAAKHAKKYAPQTLLHIRNCVSAIFTHATEKRIFKLANPALGVKLPEMKRAKKHALTLEQAHSLIAAYPSPAKEMSLLAVATSMNRAEILGLRYGRLNLTGKATLADGETLPPYSLAIRENYNAVAKEFGSVKCRERERIVPLPDAVIEMLQSWKSKAKWTDTEDVVFVSPRRGVPLQVHNLERRKMAPVAVALGMPWATGFHIFRRTWATLADQRNFAIIDRIAGMGHSRFNMTMRYTSQDLERRRVSVDGMVNALLEAPTIEAQPAA